jgi:hypothetical protein
MKGMRVVCIREKPLYKYKIGDQFTILDIVEGEKSMTGDRYYTLVSDSGQKYGWIESKYFRLLSEVREEKLNQLL